jgi:hypothetical protein
MLANPGGAQAHLLGIDRLVDDVGDEVVGCLAVVVVVVVAQGEIAKFHSVPPPSRLQYAMVAQAEPWVDCVRRRVAAQVSTVRSAEIDGMKKYAAAVNFTNCLGSSSVVRLSPAG